MKNMIKTRRTHLKKSSLMFRCIPIRSQRAIWRFVRRFREWPEYVTEYDVERTSEEIRMQAGLYRFNFEKTGMVLYLRIYGGDNTIIDGKEYYTVKSIGAYPNGTYCLTSHNYDDSDYLSHSLVRGDGIAVSSGAKGMIDICIKNGEMIPVHNMGIGVD